MQLDKLVSLFALDSCDRVPFLQDQARKLKVSRPSYLVAVVGLLAITFMILNIGRGLIIKVITVIYPLVQTIRVLETQDYSQCKQWLSYWIVVTLVHFLDDYLYWILHYIPYYQFFRVAFLVFLFHPKYKAAEKFYDSVIHDLYISMKQQMN